MIFESLFLFVEQNLSFLNGFLLAGVILVLVGIKNVTLKDLHEHKLSRSNIHKIDEIVAWGTFYIIFGLLIAAAAFTLL